MKAKLNNVKVSISDGNSKMGRIPSVSLPPVITCAENCRCAKKCYAKRLCNLYPNVREAYARNLEIYSKLPDEYFAQIDQVITMSRYFRFHVGGDIPDPAYLEKMMRLAEKHPHCEILAFTKQYEMCNDWLDHNRKPENMHLIFSAWPGMEMNNPHDLPVAQVIFRGQAPLMTGKYAAETAATVHAEVLVVGKSATEKRLRSTNIKEVSLC